MVEPVYATLVWAVPYLGAGLMALLYLAGVRREAAYTLTSAASLLLAALLATIVGYDVLSSGRPVLHEFTWIDGLGVKVSTYVDGLSAVMIMLVSWLSFLIGVYSIGYMKGDWGLPRYFFFFTFFVGSMLLVVSADNLLLLFIGWEGTGLASYALIGHWYTDEEEYWVGVPGRKALGVPMYFEPSHSGLRAILFTRVGDIGMLIGMAAMYLLTGSLSIHQIAAEAPVWMATLAKYHLLQLVLLLFTMGALAKSAQFPFHEWLVTAMTGPTPVSALIHAATMVKAGIYLVLRFAPIFYYGAINAPGPLHDIVVHDTYQYFTIVAGLGAITAFMMATMAIVSNEFKLILAFSTASQIGYMFLAAGAAGMLVEEANTLAFSAGVLSGLSHLMSHAVFKAALFLISGWAIHVVHSRFIDKMGDFAKYMKVTAIAMWLAGLSLMGIPPLSGFFSKELTLKAAEEAHLEWGFLLGAVTALLTALYTSRLIVRVFHMPPYEKPHHEPHEAPPIMLVPYTIMALTALALGLYWPGVASFLAKAGELTAAGSLTLRVEPAELEVHLTGTVAAILVGAIAMIALVWLLYKWINVNFRALLAQHASLKALHDFLFDRWYINAIIYIVIVYGFAGIAMFLAGVDFGIDWFYHTALIAVFGAFSYATRALHRGRPEYIVSLYLYLAGLAMLLAYLLWR
ncbi:MAG: NADH-quinone oxidoreductase subunit L [Desulfurococcales archaeon]|nr:NADH-quinone oxidoreductase subunit L [Desulfurococcales archaeon]